MKNTVTVDKQALESLLEYFFHSEAKSFEEHCDNGGKKEDHIYWKGIEVEKSMIKFN
jgi:hypothetical protein